MSFLAKTRFWMVPALLGLVAAARICAMPPQPDAELAAEKTAANRGSPDAQFLVGLRYSFGDGVREDPVAAERWLRVAAEAGFAPARRELAEFYLLQGSDWLLEGRKWLILAAERGDEESMDLLSSLSAKGLLGVPPPSQAVSASAQESRLAGSESARFAADQTDTTFVARGAKDVPAGQMAEKPPSLPHPESIPR